MFSLIMFAIIGATLDLGVWYWLAYACYTGVVIARAVVHALED